MIYDLDDFWIHFQAVIVRPTFWRLANPSPSRGGYIVFLALGALSLLGLLLFSLSNRFSSHVRIITLLDQRSVARHCLESYAHDILFQLREQMVVRQGPFFQKVTDWLRRGIPAGSQRLTADEVGYRPGTLLSELAASYRQIPAFQLELDANPEIELSQWQTMPPPAMFAMDSGRVWPESQGRLRLTCRARVANHPASLSLVWKFALVMQTVPVIKDFGFFFDRLDEEQSFGPSGARNDQINLLELEQGELANAEFFPLALGSFQERARETSLLNDPNLTGRVFLGRETKPILLNLGGEIGLPMGKGRFSDLWAVRLNHFSIPLDTGQGRPTTPSDIKALGLQSMALLDSGSDSSGQRRALRSANIPLRDPLLGGTTTMIGASLFVLGFGLELKESNPQGLFAGSRFRLSSFLAQDPGLSYLQRDEQRLGRASLIKPFGFSLDSSLMHAAAANPALARRGYQEILDTATRLLPVREIYGMVLRRYIVLSYFGIGSRDGVLPYQPEQSYQQPFLTKPGYSSERYYFEPLGPGGGRSWQNYAACMSRIVSGDEALVATLRPEMAKYPSGVESYDLDATQQGRPRSRPRTSRDFTSPEGIRFSSEGSLDLVQNYLRVRSLGSTSESTSQPMLANSIQGRLMTVFANGEEFKRRAFRTDQRGRSVFHPCGIALVNGDLDLSEGVSASLVQGGMILLNGNLKLGNIDRGVSASARWEDIVRKATTMGQDEVLTFVVVSGASPRTITLTGQRYIGVHLVALDDTRPTELILERPVLFIGGLALSRPNLRRLCRTLRQGSQESAFFYLPALGRTPPTLAFDVPEQLDSYGFEFH